MNGLQTGERDAVDVVVNGVKHSSEGEHDENFKVAPDRGQKCHRYI